MGASYGNIPPLEPWGIAVAVTLQHNHKRPPFLQSPILPALHRFQYTFQCGQHQHWQNSNKEKGKNNVRCKMVQNYSTSKKTWKNTPTLHWYRQPDMPVLHPGLSWGCFNASMEKVSPDASTIWTISGGNSGCLEHEAWICFNCQVQASTSLPALPPPRTGCWIQTLWPDAPPCTHMACFQGGTNILYSMLVTLQGWYQFTAVATLQSICL